MNPVEWLRRDRARAKGEGDPYAELCALATVSADGAPTVRTLVLRDLQPEADRLDDHSRGRLAVFINDSSPKWSALNPAQPGISSASSSKNVTSLAVYLPKLQVQYRLCCTTKAVDAAVVHHRWRDRPEAPRKLDWYYEQRPQSSPVSSRNELLTELEALPLPQPLIAPPSARGLYLVPTEVERLDLNQPNGVHDRRQWHWRRGWRERTLVP